MTRRVDHLVTGYLVFGHDGDLLAADPDVSPSVQSGFGVDYPSAGDGYVVGWDSCWIRQFFFRGGCI